MPVAGGIALLVLGAILNFAVTGSIRGLDLRVVGVILMAAGALALLLPRLVRTRPAFRNRLVRNRSGASQPATRSRQDVIDQGGDEPLAFVEPALDDPSLDDRRTRRRRRPWVRSG